MVTDKLRKSSSDMHEVNGKLSDERVRYKLRIGFMYIYYIYSLAIDFVRRFQSYIGGIST